MIAAIASPPLKRFLWKEYRMLRGLWLAVLVLGLLVDWLLSALLSQPADFPTVRFCVALAAATLYAAGAAAVLFSVEHEEQTYDFLRGLPATWRPLFAGKLLIATISAVALAVVLAILGFLPGRFQLPSTLDLQYAASVLGVAIFEAVAWGTLCSLIFKRPLAAAMATLVVGSLVTSTAVDAMNTAALPLSDPAAYATAIPLRLAIVITVLGLSVAVARRWLGVGIFVPRTSTRDSTKYLTRVRARIGARRTNYAIRFHRTRRFATILRLIWQTWRESWKFLVLPVTLAAACLAIGLSGGWVRGIAKQTDIFFPVAACSLICCLAASPALLGALTFTADQRRGGVRFLAEHAASPRFVWLSRQIVWLGMLVLLTAVVIIAAAMLITNFVHANLREYQQMHDDFGPSIYDAREIRNDIATGVYAGTTAMTFACCGALAAYAIGQFCSMLLKSEIVSAFTSLVLAVVLIAWVLILVAWGLSSWMFVLPLAIAFLSATWLRAPYWVVGRNSWRTWVLPASAITGTIAVFAIMLPQIRLNQVRSVPSPLRVRTSPMTTPTESALFTKQHDKEAAATAEMYVKAANLLTAPIALSPLESWAKPEFAYDGPNSESTIDEKKIPADQLSQFHTAEQKLLDLQSKQRAAALKLALEASQRPTCQFKFPLSLSQDALRYAYNITLRLEPSQTYEALNRLLQSLISTPTVDSPLEQILAALRMNRHMAMNQPAAIVVRQLRSERQILAEIAKTMAAKDRTNAERRTAIEKLQAFYQRNPVLDQTFVAELYAIRDVINGKEPPLILASKPIANDSYFAFTANELPWERERALLALDLITDQNRQNALDLKNALAQTAERNGGAQVLRAWYRPIWQPAMWLTQQPAAATSYLVSMEYQLRVPVNELFLEYCHTITVERATLLQIALAMYRADHKEYPPTLEALVPDYLKDLSLDPCNGQPFQYRPTGFDNKLLWDAATAGVGVPAHTALLWSAGPDNLQIRERVTTNTNDAAETENRASDDKFTQDQRDLSKRGLERSYGLEPADRGQRYTFTSAREFVFPLPK